MTSKRLMDLILGDSLKMVKPKDRKAFIGTVKYYLDEYNKKNVPKDIQKITLNDLIN